MHDDEPSLRGLYLSRSFGKGAARVAALQDVSLTVQRGEVTLFMGRALIKGPDFCFADEPTSALDWAHGQPVVEMLRAAARDRDASVLIVSHDPRLIPYADRVFHLADGCLVEPEEMAAFPLHGTT